MFAVYATSTPEGTKYVTGVIMFMIDESAWIAGSPSDTIADYVRRVAAAGLTSDINEADIIDDHWYSVLTKYLSDYTLTNVRIWAE